MISIEGRFVPEGGVQSLAGRWPEVLSGTAPVSFWNAGGHGPSIERPGRKIWRTYANSA